MKMPPKTNAQRQAELIEQRKQAGEKRVMLWINQNIAEQAKASASMNQTQAMIKAMEIGFYAMKLIKESDPSIYLDMVEGDLSGLQKKLDDFLL